jgi:hypothetical protein
MAGSSIDLDAPRAEQREMTETVRLLESAPDSTTLSREQVAGLTENARRVAKKYWETKGQRSLDGLRSQLSRPRWRFLPQAPEAQQMLKEIVEDSGLKDLNVDLQARQ